MKRQRLLEDWRMNAELLGDSVDFALPLSRFMNPDADAEAKEPTSGSVQFTAMTPFMVLLSHRREPRMIVSSTPAREQEDPSAGGYKIEDHYTKIWMEVNHGLELHNIPFRELFRNG